MMRILLISLAVLLNAGLYAQQQDSTEVADKPWQTFQFSSTDFENDLAKGVAVDSALRPILFATPTLPPYGFNTGYLATPGGSFWWQFDNEIGFNLGLNYLDNHRITRDSVRYFSTNQPYSRITFTNGSKQEIGLLGQHTQNINESWNVGVDYDRTSGEGFFSRQKSRRSNLVLTSNYVAPGNRYRVLAHYYYSRSIIEENGGLTDQVAFRELDGQFSANGLLSNSFYLSSAQNDVRFNRLLVKQMFRFGQRVPVSAPGDSVEVTRIRPRIQVYHQFDREFQRHLFTDDAPDSAYYSTLIRSDEYRLDVQDLIRATTWNNQLGIQNGVSSEVKVPFIYRVYAKHQLIDFRQSINRWQRDNLFVGGELGLNFGQFGFKSEVESAVGGFNSGDFRVGFALGRNTELDDTVSYNWDYDAYLRFNRERTGYIQERFTSNYLGWSNSFDKTSTAQLGVRIQQKEWGLKFGGGFSQLDNLIYYDSTAVPFQFGGGTSLLQVYVEKVFRLGHFYFTPGFRFQDVGDDNLLPLPQWMSYSSAYYQGNWFHNAVTAQMGIDAFYSAAFNRPGYSPVHRTFYNQPVEADGYPMVDVYFAMRIKKVRAYLKVQHANAGLMGSNYSLVEGYPMAFRTIRFGLDWVFLN